MKKMFSMAALIILSCAYVSAQNVGIGTPTPEQKLQVVDTVDVADGINGAFINIQNATQFSPTGTLSGIRFRLDGVNAGVNARYKGGIFFEKTSSFGVGKLHFATNNLGNNTSITTADAQMTVAADGKVGINNSSPSRAQLEIISSATNFPQLMTTTAIGATGISHSVPLGLSPTIGFNLYYSNSHKFMGPGYGATITYNPGTGTLAFNSSQTKGLAEETAFFNSTSLTIDSSGWVGIATSQPKARLHVNSSMIIGSTATLPATGYLLSVNGKIMAEEVRVQLDADWPDYVFDKKYRLRPLSEVERFIETNSHLPNIPSAKQVSAEGILLGDMQTRVLEKVEELTLYVIQLNKENQQLKLEVAALRNQIEKK
jgi:hypothetical protein